MLALVIIPNTSKFVLVRKADDIPPEITRSAKTLDFEISFLISFNTAARVAGDMFFDIR
jgi:hypothetical protein